MLKKIKDLSVPGSDDLLKIGIVVAIIILFSIFIVRPAAVGYGIYRTAEDKGLSGEDYVVEIGDLKNQVAGLSSNLSVCAEEKENVSSELKSANSETLACKSNLGTMQESLDDSEQELNNSIENFNKKLEKKDKEVDSLNKVIDTTATRLCCINKIVGDSKINSYDIEDDKVKCTEDGEHEISC